MDVNRILAYAVWLGIVALTAMLFRAASCEETTESYKTRSATCTCLELNRVAVTVNESDTDGHDRPSKACEQERAGAAD